VPYATAMGSANTIQGIGDKHIPKIDNVMNTDGSLQSVTAPLTRYLYCLTPNRAANI
jgi:hypothetical protein